MKIECDCEEFKKWDKSETGIYLWGWSHGIFYPADDPSLKYCPFCGKKLVDKDKEEK